MQDLLAAANLVQYLAKTHHCEPMNTGRVGDMGDGGKELRENKVSFSGIP